METLRLHLHELANQMSQIGLRVDVLWEERKRQKAIRNSLMPQHLRVEVEE